jgi:hypothetical protein
VLSEQSAHVAILLEVVVLVQGLIWSYAFCAWPDEVVGGL